MTMTNDQDSITIFQCAHHEFANERRCPVVWEELTNTNAPTLRYCPVCECPVELRSLPGNLADVERARRYYACRLRDPRYRAPTERSIYLRCHHLFSHGDWDHYLSRTEQQNKGWSEEIQRRNEAALLDSYRRACEAVGCPAIWENLAATATTDQGWCRHCQQVYQFPAEQQAGQPFFRQMAYSVRAADEEVAQRYAMGFPADDNPKVDIYLEPVATLNFAQLRLVREVAGETAFMLELKAKYCDQQRHLLVEHAWVEQAIHWLDEFIRLQIPFTISAVHKGGLEE
jgi:hypothetical protein